MPRVSVVIPTYNRETILAKTLDSVFCQTFQDFEVIIVDDGSYDNTEKLVRRYIDLHGEKVRYIYQEHKNVSRARNNGINNAKGEFVAFLDSDDVWFPHKLEKQVNYLDRADVAFVHTGRQLVCMPNNKRSKLFPISRKMARSRRELLGGYSTIAMTVMAKKEVFAETGVFDETLTTTQDTDLWIRIAKKFEIGFIDEPLMVSYKYEDSLCSSNFEQKYTDRIEVFKRVLADDHPDIIKSIWKQSLMNHCYALALEKYRKGEYQEFTYWIKKSLFNDFLIGRIFIQETDPWYEKLKKCMDPYWLFLKSSLLYLSK